MKKTYDDLTPEQKAMLPPPKPRRAIAAAVFGLIMTALLLGVGGVFAWLYFDSIALKLVLPDPKPAPPTTLSWDDPRVGALADPHLRCTQRMDALLRAPACRYARTVVNGPQIHCPLDHPLEALDFGCGPYGDEPASPRFTVTATSDAGLTWLSIQAQRWLGDCRAQAAGPVVGEPPRWPQDLGVAACFWLGGLRERGDQRAFPSGVFALFQPLPLINEAAYSWRSRARPAAPLPTTLPLRALILDAAQLSPAERAEIDPIFQKLFHRDAYVRSELSLKMETYSQATAPPSP
jgi:hypothetical protein